MGGREIFIAKYNSGGGLLWAKKIGGTSDDYANALRVDSAGNVYITGSFQGSVDFDPNAGTAFMSSNGLDDIFIAKYSSSGLYQWAKKIGGGQSDAGATLELDSNGDMIVTGYFSVQADFDPDAGVTNLISNGGRDAFLARFTDSGSLVWAKNVGGSQEDNGTSLHLDDKGNSYFTGSFQGIADFDPEATDYFLTSLGAKDVFISSFTASGDFIWAKGFGGGGEDSGGALQIGPDGRIYLTGIFQNVVDFDPGAPSAMLTASGDDDIFLACYDTLDGAYHWAKRIGGISSDNSKDLQISNSGDIYLTGHFSLTGTFKNGTPGGTLISAGGRDIFIACYGLSGALKWVSAIGGSSDDSGNTILINSDGSLYAGGYFRGTVDFDPGPAQATLTASSFFDIFIAKYTLCLPVFIEKSPAGISACENDSIAFSAESLNATTYSWFVSNDGGLSWAAITDTSGNYSGSNTQNLDIHQVNVGQDGLLFRMIAQSSCGLSDTSGVALLTVLPASASSELINICSGETYIFPDGTSADTSVIHISALQSVNGCDSIITSTLIVNSVDTAVTLDGKTLSAQGSVQSVQWVDCGNGYTPIPGATGATFTPAVNGMYAAIITNNNCTDTSTCFLVIVSPTKDNPAPFGFTVHPNPFSDMLRVDNPGLYSGDTRIRITDILGNDIYDSAVNSLGKETIIATHWRPGVYCLQIHAGNKVFAQIIIKK
ncbi:MAG: T9SS type A sorting domain-containing protein [Thermoanaerobaculia bacterium]|nr:T9SS type A sorting domain-containing protein [Thermoanaerobaculia bacterium]